MKVFVASDDGQFHRLERAIAEFESRSPGERMRKVFLLQAMQLERAELLRCNPHLRHADQSPGPRC
jgi:hypothetical protein